MQTPNAQHDQARPTDFRERLWPSAWVFLSTGLVMPASFLVFLPINVFVGYVVAAGLYGAVVAVLITTSPVVAVRAGTVVAGRASLPIGFAGEPTSFAKQEAVLERGQRLDARAWLVIRGWIDPVVKIPVTDDADATPYWLVSTRRPTELTAAITAARVAAASA